MKHSEQVIYCKKSLTKFPQKIIYRHHPFVATCRIGPVLRWVRVFFEAHIMNRVSFFFDGFNIFHSLDINEAHAES